MQKIFKIYQVATILNRKSLSSTVHSLRFLHEEKYFCTVYVVCVRQSESENNFYYRQLSKQNGLLL